MRPFRVLAVGIALALAGCTPPDGVSTPPNQPQLNLTQPGAAAAMVERLLEAVGSTRVLQVELTATEAHVTLLRGQVATTYAYRDGQISPIDSDIEYVGQALFDPRTFALSDLGEVFDRAARVAGSSSNQQLQIVDYDAGAIYMSVTTTPETRPVFFTPDGAEVEAFDPTDPRAVEPVIDQVSDGDVTVLRLGITSAGEVWAEHRAGTDQVVRVIRAPHFPIRDQLRSEPNPPGPFNPDLVSADTISRLLHSAADHLGQPIARGYAMTIWRPAGHVDPIAEVTWNGATVRLTLGGTVIGG
ncbi:MAG: hypothetical protein LBV06_05310 [Propionibacteriaceae bacterium]|nr:hypothetical protein [Propionibacteriaceae bacterium]